MIDHVSLQVNDLASSASFYRAVLVPLGLKAIHTDGEWVGFADLDRAPFWFGPAVEHSRPRELHIAFTAGDRIGSGTLKLKTSGTSCEAEPGKATRKAGLNHW